MRWNKELVVGLLVASLLGSRLNVSAGRAP